MNKSDLTQAFWSWMDGVAATLNAALARARPARHIRLVEEENDTFRLDKEPHGERADVATRIRIEGGAVADSLPKHLLEFLQDSQTELVLRPDRFLFRPLDLPKKAGDFLEGIVRSQVDRLTPWSAADAAFGWTPPAEIVKDRISLTVVATARALIAPYVGALTALGTRSVSVSTLAQTGGSGDVPVGILQETGASALDPGKIRHALATVLLVAMASMAVLVAADQVIGSVLETQKSDILRQVAERRATIRRDGLTGATSPQLVLDHRKHDLPSSVIVLEALSQILPDHTYATELRVEGDKLQVVGITHDAPSLIRLIEQSPHFMRATFFAPTTRSASDPGERFHIEARIKPDFTVQR